MESLGDLPFILLGISVIVTVFIQIYFDIHPDGWFCVTVHDRGMCNWVTSEFDTEYEYESDDESLEGDIENAVSKVLEKYKERVK
jgi:hypothetical protein